MALLVTYVSPSFGKSICAAAAVPSVGDDAIGKFKNGWAGAFALLLGT
jgi:hypothetical protein